MTFKEAFDKCEWDEWEALVIVSPKNLGPNACITYSYNTDHNGRLKTSEKKQLSLLAYLNDDFLTIQGPFTIYDMADGWEAKPFVIDDSELFDPTKVKLDDDMGKLEQLRTGKNDYIPLAEIIEYFE